VRLNRVLDPADRISEILFGLIMVLTYTSALSVATAGRADVKTMLLGALGCNLAWGIIDAGLYLLSSLNERGREILMLRAVRSARDAAAAHREIGEVLPAPLAQALSVDQIETVRQKLQQVPELPGRPRLTGRDWLGALGICLLVFLSTFPVVIPFVLVGDAKLALRISNLIVIVMLFLCGYAFARHTGVRPWPMGLLMIAVGLALAGVAIALGG
jgi:VIT1/CCC1 family predicted Fe2+/Mn2+ transporter